MLIPLFCMTAAAGRPQGLDPDFIEVVPLDAARGGMVAKSGAAWIRTQDGCVAGTIEPGEPAEFSVQICTRETAGVHVSCTWDASLTTTWWDGSLVCTSRRADGVELGIGGGGGSSHGNPELIELSQDRMVWRPPFQVAAEPEEQTRTQRPCTPESIAAAPEGAGLKDGKRTCAVSAGMSLYIVPVGWGRTGGGMGFVPTPVDCREPCPADPEAELSIEANAWLKGKHFSSASDRVVQIFAKEADCLASVSGPGKPVQMPEGKCDPRDPAWGELADDTSE